MMARPPSKPLPLGPGHREEALQLLKALEIDVAEVVVAERLPDRPIADRP